MYSFKTILKNEITRYLYISKLLESRDGFELDGHLEITKRNQFYHHRRDHDTGKCIRRYIKKCEIQLAKDLAQGTYEDNLRRLVNKRVTQLSEIYNDFGDDEVDDLYDNLCDARKELIVPMVPTLRDKLDEWKSKEFLGLGFRDDDYMVFTDKKERVRSKSEKIMANIFIKFGLEYKYECPFVTKSGKKFHPDFTFYNARLNREIYWEHFGKMDDPDYANSTIKKIEEYSNSGVVIGKKSNCNI